VFYDRMALVDSAVNAGFIWILFLSLVLVKTRRLDIALLMGFVGGIALLAKSSSRMFLGLTATAPLLYLGLWKKDKTSLFSNSLNYFFLLGVVAFISLLFYNIQMLSPYMHYVELKNTTFIMTGAEFMAEPFKFFKNNIFNIPLYVAWEAGWIIVGSSVIGYALLIKKDRLLALYLSVFVIVPYIAIAFFAKVLFPRYVLFFASLLVLFATYFFLSLKNKRQLIASMGVLLVSMSVYNYALLFDPPRASFPPVDRGQYVEGSTAVWGVERLMALVREVSRNRPVLILAEGDFGLIADVLRVYDQPDDAIDVLGLWPLTDEHLYDYQGELERRDVFVVYGHREDFPDHLPIELVEEYKKPGNKKSLYLFKLLPPQGEAKGGRIKDQ
ncbi:hypothetical protein KBD81_01225, partial [Candidatus Woesebacteria bacterium]|nr:hypothetical protein [Candidatus Woesebacteria bacterium]